MLLEELSYNSLSDSTDSIFHLHNHHLAKIDRSREMNGESRQGWFVQSSITTRDGIYSLFKPLK